MRNLQILFLFVSHRNLSQRWNNSSKKYVTTGQESETQKQKVPIEKRSSIGPTEANKNLLAIRYTDPYILFMFLLLMCAIPFAIRIRLCVLPITNNESPKIYKR